jgi:hypothetical protein
METTPCAVFLSTTRFFMANLSMPIPTFQRFLSRINCLKVMPIDLNFIGHPWNKSSRDWVFFVKKWKI